MPALTSITAVRPTQTTRIIGPVVYGATISAGQTVYLDTADSKYKLADANLSAAAAAAKGIAVTPGVDTGYGYVATGGSIVLVGTTMAIGEHYSVGATAGDIVPNSDLTSGWYCTDLGTAASATQLDLNIVVTGISHA